MAHLIIFNSHSAAQRMNAILKESYYCIGKLESILTPGKYESVTLDGIILHNKRDAVNFNS